MKFDISNLFTAFSGMFVMITKKRKTYIKHLISFQILNVIQIYKKHN